MTFAFLGSLVLIAAAMCVLAFAASPTAVVASASPDLKSTRSLATVRASYLRGEIDRDEYEWRALELLTS